MLCNLVAHRRPGRISQRQVAALNFGGESRPIGCCFPAPTAAHRIRRDAHWLPGQFDVYLGRRFPRWRRKPMALDILMSLHLVAEERGLTKKSFRSPKAHFCWKRRFETA